jgi:hypothetical protein
MRNGVRISDVEKRRYDLSEFVHDKVIFAEDPAAAVTSVEPTFPGYLKTLPLCTAIANSPGWIRVRRCRYPQRRSRPAGRTPTCPA